MRLMLDVNSHGLGLRKIVISLVTIMGACVLS